MIWVDEYAQESKQARKIVTKYSCDCRNPKKGKYDTCSAGVFYPTKVVNDEICKYCGHYAFRIDKQILKNNGLIRKAKRGLYTSPKRISNKSKVL